ncbi:FliG C-terminal domain-containing protein [Paracoccaceae bacterium GXU_MW_L88]
MSASSAVATQKAPALPAKRPTGTEVETLYSQLEKAAILLAAMGREHAADVLRMAEERDLVRLAMATSSLKSVSHNDLNNVIEEFIETLAETTGIYGGTDIARSMLGAVLDENGVARIMSDVEGGAHETIWSNLSKSDPAALARFLEREHPQTAALIVAQLSTGTASQTLELMDRELARKLVLRLSNIPSPDSRLTELLSEPIEKDFFVMQIRPGRTKRPADLIGGLLNNVSSARREDLMEKLQSETPELAKEVAKTIFTFEHIAVRVRTGDVPSICRAIDETDLITALAHGKLQSSETVGFLLENLPKRLAERLEADVEERDDFTPKEGEAAQQLLVQAVLDAESDGSIRLIKQEDA